VARNDGSRVLALIGLLSEDMDAPRPLGKQQVAQHTKLVSGVESAERYHG